MSEMNANKVMSTKKLYMDTYESSLGRITMTSDGELLKGLWIEGQHHYADSLKESPVERSLPVFEQTKVWLEDYFAGRMPGALPPLAPEGSEFRQRVWELLLEIPYGQTRTYSDIAKQLAEERGLRKMAAQAVGGAVGHNPISILIPCHRVVGKDGSLVGYGGGLDKKVALLGIEGWLDPEDYRKF